MSLPRDDQIILRVGGRTWARYGVPWRRQDRVVRDAYALTRATTARLVDSQGVMRQAAANAPRLDYTSMRAGVTADPVWLLEPTRTNLCLQSQNFSTTWAPGAFAPTIGAADTTIGQLVLDLLTDDQAGASEYLSQEITFTGDGLKGVSCFAKAGTASASSISLVDDDTFQARLLVSWGFDGSGVLQTPIASTGTLLRTWFLSNGVYRIEAQATGVVAANTNLLQVNGAHPFSATGSGRIGGVQCENAAYPSSYIPTTTTTQTRNAETPTIPIGFPQIVSSLYLDYVEYTSAYSTLDTRMAVIGGANFTAPYFGIQRFQSSGIRAIFDSGAGFAGSGFLSGGNPGDRVRCVARLYSDGHVEFERRINSGAASSASASSATSLGSAGWNAQTLRLNGGNGGSAEALGLVDCAVLSDTFTLAECEAVL